MRGSLAQPRPNHGASLFTEIEGRKASGIARNLMKINANQIKRGMLLGHDGRLWRVIKTQHVKPGKGGAFCQAEMKDVRNGSKLNERFRSSEDVERVRLTERSFQCLYPEGGGFAFMDQETFDQLSLTREFIGEDSCAFLHEGMVITVSFYEEEAISVSLPETVICEVAEADAVVKGQTATSSFKPALLDNGVKSMVPLHVEAGSRIVVNTEDGSYVERAK